MAKDHFDLDRVQRNWERAAAPPDDSLPPRFAEIPPPLDPFPEARSLLERIRLRASAQFAAQAETLTPFFNEAASLIRRLEEATSPPEGGEAAPAKDVEEEREALQELLHDLEDLLEVFAQIGR